VMANCRGCPYGTYDALSDVCDGCMSDPHTGWYGFRDHRAGRDFDTSRQQERYYDSLANGETEEDDCIGDGWGGA
jgi:hypothetical protein